MNPLLRAKIKQKQERERVAAPIIADMLADGVAIKDEKIDVIATAVRQTNPLATDHQIRSLVEEANGAQVKIESGAAPSTTIEKAVHDGFKKAAKVVQSKHTDILHDVAANRQDFYEAAEQRGGDKYSADPSNNPAPGTEEFKEAVQKRADRLARKFVAKELKKADPSLTDGQIKEFIVPRIMKTVARVENSLATGVPLDSNEAPADNLFMAVKAGYDANELKKDPVLVAIRDIRKYMTGVTEDKDAEGVVRNIAVKLFDITTDPDGKPVYKLTTSAFLLTPKQKLTLRDYLNDAPDAMAKIANAVTKPEVGSEKTVADYATAKIDLEDSLKLAGHATTVSSEVVTVIESFINASGIVEIPTLNHTQKYQLNALGLTEAGAATLIHKALPIFNPTLATGLPEVSEFQTAISKTMQDVIDHNKYVSADASLNAVVEGALSKFNPNGSLKEELTYEDQIALRDYFGARDTTSGLMSQTQDGNILQQVIKDLHRNPALDVDCKDHVTITAAEFVKEYTHDNTPAVVVSDKEKELLESLIADSKFLDGDVILKGADRTLFQRVFSTKEIFAAAVSRMTGLSIDPEIYQGECFGAEPSSGVDYRVAVESFKLPTADETKYKSVVESEVYKFSSSGKVGLTQKEVTYNGQLAFINYFGIGEAGVKQFKNMLQTIYPSSKLQDDSYYLGYFIITPEEAIRANNKIAKDDATSSVKDLVLDSDIATLKSGLAKLDATGALKAGEALSYAEVFAFRKFLGTSAVMQKVIADINNVADASTIADCTGYITMTFGMAIEEHRLNKGTVEVIPSEDLGKLKAMLQKFDLSGELPTTETITYAEKLLANKYFGKSIPRKGVESGAAFANIIKAVYPNSGVSVRHTKKPEDYYSHKFAVTVAVAVEENRVNKHHAPKLDTAKVDLIHAVLDKFDATGKKIPGKIMSCDEQAALSEYFGDQNVFKKFISEMRNVDVATLTEDLNDDVTVVIGEAVAENYPDYVCNRKFGIKINLLCSDNILSPAERNNIESAFSKIEPDTGLLSVHSLEVGGGFTADEKEALTKLFGKESEKKSVLMLGSGDADGIIVSTATDAFIKVLQQLYPNISAQIAANRQIYETSDYLLNPNSASEAQKSIFARTKSWLFGTTKLNLSPKRLILKSELADKETTAAEQKAAMDILDSLADKLLKSLEFKGFTAVPEKIDFAKFTRGLHHVLAPDAKVIKNDIVQVARIVTSYVPLYGCAEYELKCSKPNKYAESKDNSALIPQATKLMNNLIDTISLCIDDSGCQSTLISRVFGAKSAQDVVKDNVAVTDDADKASLITVFSNPDFCAGTMAINAASAGGKLLAKYGYTAGTIATSVCKAMNPITKYEDVTFGSYFGAPPTPPSDGGGSGGGAGVGNIDPNLMEFGDWLYYSMLHNFAHQQQLAVKPLLSTIQGDDRKNTIVKGPVSKAKSRVGKEIQNDDLTDALYTLAKLLTPKSGFKLSGLNGDRMPLGSETSYRDKSVKDPKYINSKKTIGKVNLGLPGEVDLSSSNSPEVRDIDNFNAKQIEGVWLNDRNRDNKENKETTHSVLSKGECTFAQEKYNSLYPHAPINTSCKDNYQQAIADLRSAIQKTAFCTEEHTSNAQYVICKAGEITNSDFLE